MKFTKQTLLINEDAMLLQSCDSLFATDDLRNRNIILYFPFLESVFDDLLKRLKKENRIVFKGVETKHSFLPGYYDYIFNVMYKNKKKVIKWQILDTTIPYQAIKINQQNHHEKSVFPNQNTPDIS